MSGVTNEPNTEGLHKSASSGDQQNSLSSDSGVSSCSSNSNNSKDSNNKEGTSNSNSSAGHREKSQKKQEEKKARSKERDNFFHSKFSRGGGVGGGDRDYYSDFFEDDPFFADKANKFFGKSYSSRFANRPRLSERLFGNKHNRERSSIFDNDNFVSDLRKRIEEEKKMFFDGGGGSDPFGSAFTGRASSPVGGSGGTGRVS